jgi:hypothetical protein
MAETAGRGGLELAQGEVGALDDHSGENKADADPPLKGPRYGSPIPVPAGVES